MHKLYLVVICWAFLGCSQNDHLNISDINPSNTPGGVGEDGGGEAQCANFNYLLPQIDQSSISGDSDSPYFLNLTDASISSGTIVSRLWEIEDVRDFLASPAGAGCASEPDCRFTGTPPASNTGPTFNIPSVGTTSTNGNHDDFIVRLTVTDSNGLTAKTSFLYISFFPGQRLITTLRLSAPVSTECSATVTVNTVDYRDNIGSDADDVTLDVGVDQIYEEERTLVTFPQTISYDFNQNGNYTNALLIESDGFDGASPNKDQLYYINYGIGFTSN